MKIGIAHKMIVFLGLVGSLTSAMADPAPPPPPTPTPEQTIRAAIRLKRIRFELETIATITGGLENVIANSIAKNQELPLGSACMRLGALAQEVPSAYGTTAADERFVANATIQHGFRESLAELLIFYGYCDGEEPADLGHVPTQADVRASNLKIAAFIQGIRTTIDALVKP